MTALPSGPPGYCDVTGHKLRAATFGVVNVVGICRMPNGGFIIRAIDGVHEVSRTAATLADLHAAIDEYGSARS